MSNQTRIKYDKTILRKDYSVPWDLLFVENYKLRREFNIIASINETVFSSGLSHRKQFTSMEGKQIM